VKFLLDNQLPRVLAEFFQERGLDCVHVLDVGLGRERDREICDFAMREDRIIITKDKDFFYYANQPGSEIRLLWVRLGNCRTCALLAAFERIWLRVENSFAAGERVIEIRS